MRYVIEYLRESTDESSVCHTVNLEGACLNDVGVIAFDGATPLRLSHGARGFQIRDKTGSIVALETLDL